MRRAGILTLAFTLGACGGDAEPPFDVAVGVISHETTQDISVWAPEAKGSWPIVYAVPGASGYRTRWDVTGPALASRGVVVFATDHDASEPAGLEQDVECGYRYVMSIAQEFNGDLGQPVTFVGHSLGASLVLLSGLDEAAYGPGGTYDVCFTGAPRPDAIVAIAGCHYQFLDERHPFRHGRTNLDADLVLVTGADDNICEPWQSEDAAEALRSAGYEVDVVEIAGANHYTLIFHDLTDRDLVLVPEEPAGIEVVQTILDAIAAAE